MFSNSKQFRIICISKVKKNIIPKTIQFMKCWILSIPGKIQFLFENWRKKREKNLHCLQLISATHMHTNVNWPRAVYILTPIAFVFMNENIRSYRKLRLEPVNSNIKSRLVHIYSHIHTYAHAHAHAHSSCRMLYVHVHMCVCTVRLWMYVMIQSPPLFSAQSCLL